MLLRDQELWFDDGNLVLVAGGVQFCVYKGLLVSQSAVFKDMLSLPQPASDDAPAHNEPLSSCATVHLSDSPEDLRHFLRAFTNGKLRDATIDAIHLNRCSRVKQGRAWVQRGIGMHPIGPQVPMRACCPKLHQLPQEVLRRQL